LFDDIDAQGHMARHKQPRFGKVLDKLWLETGFFYLDHQTWVHAETLYRNFTDPVVFLSLPA
jgi:hypothetical protein